MLEIEILEALHPARQLELDVKELSQVDVDQFYGIEIEEFPAHIAEAAMWLVDHQMNMRLSESFGQSFIRLPLQKSAHITHGNALEIDWKRVIPSEQLNYILGNPPFVGARKKTLGQSEEMEKVFSGVKGAGNLDYVAAWYLLAAKYIQGTNIKVAFVSTNSITQGEQVGTLWSVLLKQYHIDINFAHRTFKWTIDEKKAKGMKIASVFCVIIGFSSNVAETKKLFDYETLTSDPHRIAASNISPYLVDTENTLILKRSKPLDNAPEILFGNMPNDGGHLLLSDEEKNQLLIEEPQAEKFIRPFVSSEEFINGISRWCIWLQHAQPAEIKSLKNIYARIEKVKETRLKSPRPATQKLAATPWLFGEIRQPTKDYLLIPKSSSEQRSYIPIAVVPENVIATEALIVAEAELYHFGVLTSQMHMDWMRYTSGRIKSDYRYSNTIVYNNFPWPQITNETPRKVIEEKAQSVLDARKQYPTSTLSDLYNPTLMPANLLTAHRALDKAVDLAYRKQPFASERERVEFLFGEYRRLSEPLIATTKKKERKA